MSRKRDDRLSAERTKTINVGCAGWSIPREIADLFPEGASHLSRYAAKLPAVEINSSFYRPHRPTTYQRWAESVPAAFRFSVKVPKVITHEHRLEPETETIDTFLEEASGLGERLGCLLVQLPPSLKFDRQVATQFFTVLRQRSSTPVACEPRHVSWFTPEANALLQDFQIARVAADPACVPEAGVPRGWGQLVYFRLHGSPRKYYSEYDAEYLCRLEKMLADASDSGADCWCIFDNTAAGAATLNAITVHDELS